MFKLNYGVWVCIILYSCVSNSDKKESVNVDQPIDKIAEVSNDDKTTELKPSESHPIRKKKELFSGKITVYIPKEFAHMSVEDIAAKYPRKVNTDYQAFSSPDGEVNLAFEHMPNNGTIERLPEFKKMFEQQFNHPLIEIQKSTIIKINGRDFILLEMITPAEGGEIFNKMFITSLEGRLLMGTFNFRESQIEKWKPIADEVVSLIVIEKGDK